PHSRGGTACHGGLAERFGQGGTRPDAPPGAADETAGEAEDLLELQRAFEESEWGRRVPIEVEVPFETIIGDRLVRGRMDAVFHDTETGRYDVVDWKTGPQPSNAAGRRAVGVDMDVYRMVWVCYT